MFVTAVCLHWAFLKSSELHGFKIGTVSKATLGKLLSDEVERMWTFPSAYIPSWTELNWTKTVLSPSAQYCSRLMEHAPMVTIHHPAGSMPSLMWFTSTETIKTIRDGEPRTATSTFTQLLSTGPCRGHLVPAYVSPLANEYPQCWHSFSVQKCQWHTWTEWNYGALVLGPCLHYVLQSVSVWMFLHGLL